MAVPFLSARWSNLALVTYALDPAVLAPLLPPGCVADVVDGRAFASLVAFDFRDTRVLGVRWPDFVDFPEVNLRFYVRESAARDARRGVTFAGELVPQRFVAWVARTLYHEPYLAVPMRCRTIEDDASITIRHTLALDGVEQTIEVVGRKPSLVPTVDSLDHFFKEHAWGFGTAPWQRGRRVCYRVAHDRWSVYPIERYDVRFDFARAYGERWRFLNDATPHHVTLAAGSAVKVYPWRGDVARSSEA